ncbi:MAG TPA: sulfatase-like hydrolase/transferase [Bryobacteraceae bacterium]|nr:sulfatase-like hydrolase/transferase [Bryobacteraceae bacterium]
MKTRRDFLRDSAAASAGLLLPSIRRSVPQETSGDNHPSPRPNIIFILADDMGFSDIGCYGSEIDTPNLDALAKGGLQLTRFYNSPRCCPSRAALMTGLYSHQTGMGMMTSDYGRYPYPAYRGDLSENCVTIAEALKAAGYNTLMVGKWHLTPLTAGKHNYPLQRGFNRYYGIINGAASYFDPASLTRDNTPIEVSKDQHDYYLTDAFGDNAVQYIEGAAHKQQPFFLYAAFTAGTSTLAAWPVMSATHFGYSLPSAPVIVANTACFMKKIRTRRIKYPTSSAANMAENQRPIIWRMPAFHATHGKGAI